MPLQQQESWSEADCQCVQEACTAQRPGRGLLKRQYRVLGHVSWEVSGYVVLTDVEPQLSTLLLMTGP